jgi:hypothetical protein
LGDLFDSDFVLSIEKKNACGATVDAQSATFTEPGFDPQIIVTLAEALHPAPPAGSLGLRQVRPNDLGQFIL